MNFGSFPQVAHAISKVRKCACDRLPHNEVVAIHLFLHTLPREANSKITAALRTLDERLIGAVVGISAFHSPLFF